VVIIAYNLEMGWFDPEWWW